MARSMMSAVDAELEAGEASAAQSKKFSWSEQQIAWFGFVEGGADHGVLIAGAGTGKTTTTFEGMRRFGGPCVYVAFGSDPAREAKAALAEKGITNGESRTSHSFGLGAVKKHVGRVDVDKEKGEKIVRKIVLGAVDADPKPWERQHLASLKKAFGFARNVNAKTERDVDDAIDHAGIEVPIRRDEFVGQVLCAMDMSKERPGSVDYDDMIWLPVALGLKPTPVDAVFADEIQDLSLLQIELLMSAVAPGGRFFGVGDPRQTLYHFRGAADDAVDNIVKRLSAKTLPLSVTYRCARKIVEKANLIFPFLQPAPGCEDGVVANVDGQKLAQLARPGDFILSRTNAPLVPLCIRLMNGGTKCAIAGRDVGKKLTDLIRKSKATSAADLVTWIEKWRVREVERLEAKDAPTDAVNDVADCLVSAAEGCGLASEVSSIVERIFVEGTDAEKVTLSTVHKAKGLERERVFVLSDTMLRKRMNKRTGQWEMPQVELNIAYVAYTRAKRELYLAQGVS